jgi:hypothetical protein
VTSWRPLLSAEFAKDYSRQSVNLGTVIVQPYLRIKRLKAIVVDSVNFTSNQIVVSHVWLPPMWMMRHPCNPSRGGDDGRRLGLVGVGGGERSRRQGWHDVFFLEKEMKGDILSCIH